MHAMCFSTLMTSRAMVRVGAGGWKAEVATDVTGVLVWEWPRDGPAGLGVLPCCVEV